MRLQNPWMCVGAVAALAVAASGFASACGGNSRTGTDFQTGYDSGAGGGGQGGGGASSGAGQGASSGASSGGSSGGGTSGGSSGGTSSGGSSGGSSGSGQSGAAEGGAGSGDAGAASSGSLCLQAGNGDYSKTGPYAVSTLSVDLADAGLSSAASPTTFTIYYPTTMKDNCHPISAWGNGTGVTGQGYSFFNQNVASWGIVVIASDNSNVDSSPYLSTGIDYLVAQNKNPSSVFYNKLTTKAGVAGHSQGGIAATGATTDPNVVAEVCVEGGGNPKQGTAVLCLTGSQTDGGLNGVNAIVLTTTYPATTGPAFLADWDGGDHVTTPTAAGWYAQNPGTIQFVRLMTAWFRCFLASDQHACTLFQGGANCGICKDPGWYELESKNL